MAFSGKVDDEETIAFSVKCKKISNASQWHAELNWSKKPTF